MEQNGWEALKTKMVFCVGIKTKRITGANGFTVSVYMDYASELAEIITLIYNKNILFFSGNLRKPYQALKTEGIAFNEIEVYQTTLAPFKISDQEKFDGIMFFPSAVESF
jgi:uroporphyrinogen-III synthase